MTATTGTISTAAFAGAYPYNVTLTHDATGGGALLVVASTASGASWNPVCTFAGTNVPLLARSNSSAGQGAIWVFGLLNPPQSSGTLRVDRRNAQDGGTSATSEFGDIGTVTAINLSGADSTSPFDVAGALHAGNSVTVPVTTTAADTLIIGATHDHYNSGADMNTPAGATALYSQRTNTNHQQFGYTKTAATAGAVSMTFATTSNSSNPIGGVVVAIKPASGGGVTNHELSASAISTGAPTAASPAVAQDHQLTAAGLIAGAPEASSAAIAQHHQSIPSTPAISAPTLDLPAVSQAHALSSADLAGSGAPALGVPALSQVHALTATGAVTGAPALGAPAVAQSGQLLPTAAVTGAPALGNPAIAQSHQLSAAGAVTGAPALGSPLAGIPAEAEADALAAGAPAAGSPALRQSHQLAASGAQVGTPAAGSPAIAQAHALTAAGIAPAPSTLGAPGLLQLHRLTASGINAGAPAVGSTAINNAVPAALPRPISATAGARSSRPPAVGRSATSAATGRGIPPSVGARPAGTPAGDRGASVPRVI